MHTGFQGFPSDPEADVMSFPKFLAFCSYQNSFTSVYGDVFSKFINKAWVWENHYRRSISSTLLSSDWTGCGDSLSKYLWGDGPKKQLEPLVLFFICMTMGDGEIVWNADVFMSFFVFWHFICWLIICESYFSESISRYFEKRIYILIIFTVDNFLSSQKMSSH